MNEKSRQKLLLGVLGFLLLIVAWRYLGPSGDGGGEEDVLGPSATYDPEAADGAAPPTLPGARQGNKAKKSGPPGRVAQLRLGDLDRVPPGYAEGRDPWRFVTPPPPPPEPAPPPPPPPSAAELAAQEEARRRAAEEAERLRLEALKPKPPEFTWEYLGNFGPANKRIAVFSDGKREYNVQEGEVLDKKFIVARIGYESVDIKFVGFPNEPAKRLGVRSRR
ncbi:MAG TPA: hypothetical protein VJ725_30545 [Thermoanaerobaculia bacterium]|nr:hypothetical protein [Thermoanaerobaculia bacterium]